MPADPSAEYSRDLYRRCLYTRASAQLNGESGHVMRICRPCSTSLSPPIRRIRHRARRMSQTRSLAQFISLFRDMAEGAGS
jgi:hypothetical protein